MNIAEKRRAEDMVRERFGHLTPVTKLEEDKIDPKYEKRIREAIDTAVEAGLQVKVTNVGSNFSYHANKTEQHIVEITWPNSNEKVQAIKADQKRLLTLHNEAMTQMIARVWNNDFTFEALQVELEKLTPVE